MDSTHGKPRSEQNKSRNVQRLKAGQMTLRECRDAYITPVLFRRIEELRQKAKRGPLNYGEVNIVKLFAKQGFPGTKELLEKHGQSF